MAKEQGASTTEEIFAAPIQNGKALRAALGRTLASSSVNAVAAGNQAILASKKRQILYKNGYTLPGTAAALLAAEALSGIEHSAKLGGNIRKAELKKNGKYKRPAETDAHHVVAAEASDADVARDIIFAVGIGINDRDNGVILPRYMTTRIKGMLRASPHQHIHTDVYYTNVVAALHEAQDMSDEQQIRAILRVIAGRLRRGQFVY